jgi:hypothetical protein
MSNRAERLLFPLGAIVAALALFGVFCAVFGANPFSVYGSIYTAAFGSWYSWQNTLTRAAPLLLCGLCTALPARAGVIVIGNEGAVVMGGLGAIAVGLPALTLAPWTSLLLMALAAMACGGLWIAISVAFQHYRGVNAVISGLLLNYIAIALMNQLIEGPLRDPTSFNKPASYPLTADHRLPYFSGTHVHYGLLFGIVACLVLWFLLDRRRKCAHGEIGRPGGGPGGGSERVSGWRMRRPGGHGGGGRGTRARQRFTERRVWIRRDSGSVSGAAESSGRTGGLASGGRTCRQRRHAAARAQSARCVDHSL